MNSFEWSRLEDLFHRAAALSPSERFRFLNAECNGDIALRYEIESLLEHDAPPGSGFQTAVEEEAEVLARQNAESFIGRRIGAYRVTGLIGEGGMGAVYRAVRDDDQYLKEVAVKLVRHGFETPALFARFREERQILASLEHPYIARLLDGGVTSDNGPYLVMELIAGVPITQYAAQHDLPLEARLRLVQKVSEAVQYAHSRLVVHRDLKPGNILITADGTPKLLDFGIATLLTDASQPRKEASRTQRLLTPDYASPEQVRGTPATVAADIYSLGAVLYELLTGRPPHRLVNSTPAEIERAICASAPVLPSHAAGLETVSARRLRGDLDNIVLKALRKEPERRYRSIEQFSEDITRHLSGRPVIARADTFGYRAAKFMRRNWLPVGAAMATALSLIAGAVGFAWQAKVADRSRLVAEQRLTALVNLSDRTLFGIHDTIASLPGAVDARRQIVRITLDYLESLNKEHAMDDRMRLVLSGAYYKVALIQGDLHHPSLGDFAGARENYRKAETILGPMYATKKDDPDMIARWLDIEAGLAEMAQASNRRAASVEAYLKLLPTAQRLTQLDHSPRALQHEAGLQGHLAELLQTTRPAQALEHANRNVALLTELRAASPSDADLKYELASGLGAVASATKGTGDLDKAARYFDQSIRMLEEMLVATPANTHVRRDLIIVYGNYAALLGMPWSSNLGRIVEAKRCAQRAVALSREMVKADRQDVTARYRLAINLARLGTLQPAPGEAAKSLEILQEAIDSFGLLTKTKPGNEVVFHFALAREYAGHRLEGLGRNAAAEEQYREALAEIETVMSSPIDRFGVQRALADEEALARLYAATGDPAKGLAFANRAVARGESYSAVDPVSEGSKGHLARAYTVRAGVRKLRGEMRQAWEDARRAVAIWRTLKQASLIAFFQDSIRDAELLARPKPKKVEKSSVR
jgi:tetratricopeptide (TPR) repeat protein